MRDTIHVVIPRKRKKIVFVFIFPHFIYWFTYVLLVDFFKEYV